MSNKLVNIGIIGSGAWGTALACNLSKKKIILWAYEKKIVSEINKFRTNKTFLPKIKIPNNIYATRNLEEIAMCKFVFICVRSQFVKKIILQFKYLIKFTE